MADPDDHRARGPGVPEEDQLARAIADPPPPRPARRAAAIAMAMARFDGIAPGPRPLEPAAPRAEPTWWRTGRAQIGVSVSIAVVALIAVPLALDHPGELASRPSPPAVAPQTSIDRPATPDRRESQRRTAVPPSPSLGSSVPTSRATPPPVPTRQVGPVREPRTDEVTSPPPPPPPPPFAAAPAPPPAAPVPGALADASGPAQRAANVADGEANIVVTGSRVRRAEVAPVRRGDWNACTVIDPEQSLRGCGGLIRPRGEREAKGAAQAAGAQVAQGLARGWQADWVGAIQAFDQAIVLQPKLGIAYLNRGLAFARLRASEKAMADLDQAVRFAPSARSYYARSRLRQDAGDIRGARADEDRAIDFDPGYLSVIRR